MNLAPPSCPERLTLLRLRPSQWFAARSSETTALLLLVVWTVTLNSTFTRLLQKFKWFFFIDLILGYFQILRLILANDGFECFEICKSHWNRLQRFCWQLCSWNHRQRRPNQPAPQRISYACYRYDNYFQHIVRKYFSCLLTLWIYINVYICKTPIFYDVIGCFGQLEGDLVMTSRYIWSIFNTLKDEN